MPRWRIGIQWVRQSIQMCGSPNYNSLALGSPLSRMARVRCHSAGVKAARSTHSRSEVAAAAAAGRGLGRLKCGLMGGSFKRSALMHAC